MTYLERIRSALTRGDQDEAIEILDRLPASKLKREDRLPLALTALRLLKRERGLEILYPIMRAKGRLRGIPPTAREIAVYGSLLSEANRYHEAQRWLRRLPEPRPALAELAMAWTHFKCWEWEKAIAPLQRLLAESGLTADERLRTQIRLGIAQLHGAEDVPAGRAALLECVAEAQRQGNATQLGAAHWMLAQCAYFQGDWAEARKQLALGLNSPFDPREPRYRLHDEQWELLIELGETGSAECAARLDGLIVRMREAGYWDLARDCEYYLIVARRDRARALRLYFSTSLEGMRRKLLRALGMSASELPAHFDLQLGEGAAPEPLELATGECAAAQSLLKPGQLSHRLLSALSSDFTVPLTGLELHDRVFPDEYFNPDTSLHRLGEAVRRLRSWLAENRLPLRVENVAGRYRLTGAPSVVIRLRQAPLSPTRAQVERLERRFGGGFFSSVEAARHLGVSRNSALGAFRKALAEGLLSRQGQGPSARYRVSSQERA